MGVKHFLHAHKLILNEAELVVGKDVECAICREPINKLIDAFYRCNTSLIDGTSSSNCAAFLMHKTCSELPPKFTHPIYPQKPLSLLACKKKLRFYSCGACKNHYKGYMYATDNYDFYLCLKCVTSELKSLEDRNQCHRGHDHPLTLVQRPALFLCDACNTTATDLSYVCTKCCFCIHKSCAEAPLTYQSKFHKEHMLILDYSLPEEYCNYVFICSICNKHINPIYWVYYCANCRFFAHVKCASSTEMLSESDNYDEDSGESNLMHFPAQDEASLCKMMQQCIMKAKDASLHNSATAEPSPYIKHWAHKHQRLSLGNKNAKISTLDLNQKLEETHELLICDGCTKPISLVDDIFYECNSCNFFLHRSCAQFPQKIEHHLAGKLRGVLAREVSIKNFCECRGCGIIGNGIYMLSETTCLDIGCASLPKVIKHEAHRHPLKQVMYSDDTYCKGCLIEPVRDRKRRTIRYGCEKCDFYIHIGCALRPHLVIHRWDPHPLYLILFVKNVPDHPHEFQCELCSKQINPNVWFYHCNPCDQSFHPYCIDLYYRFSKTKFGATNIHRDSHPHGLTLAISEKKGRCNTCAKNTSRVPVLKCAPCKYVVHWYHA